MYELQSPNSKITVRPGNIVKLNRFDDECWIVNLGWFSYAGNRPINGWYLVSKAYKDKVKPLNLSDLEDIYVIEAGEVKEDYKELDPEIKKLIHDLKVQVEELSREVAQLTAEVEAKDEVIAEKGEEILELQRQIRELQRQIEELESQHRLDAETIATLNSQVTAQAQIIAEKAAEIRELTARVAELAEENELLTQQHQEDLATIAQQASTIQAQAESIASLTDDNNRLTDENDRLTEENTELVAQHQEDTATIAEQQETISSQGEQITELSGEVTELQGEVAEQAATITRQNTTIDELNHRVPPSETPNPVTPTRNQQVIRPSGDYAGLASVTINPVTADIDSNIVPNNIRNGAVIIGVEGNYGESLEKFLTTGFGEPFTLELHGDVRSYACYKAQNLEEVSLYDGIIIGDNAFRYCPNLKRINVYGSTFVLQNYCFANTSSLETLYMPEATNIGSGAERSFVLSSSSVQNIYCPNVRTIGYHSLEKCSYLISISLPNVVSMERESFSGCSRLKTLYLGNKVSGNGINISGGENSFKGCYSLEYVTLENGFNGQINLSASTLYSVETIVSWFEALADRTGLSALSFIIGSTNLAKLTAEQKAIATNKNWNLA